MDPEIFDTWCNILKRVPNSALWLLRFPAAGETRVRSHAAARGVRPDQIVFTDVAMKNEHIRRSQLADLFLDTYEVSMACYLFSVSSKHKINMHSVSLWFSFDQPPMQCPHNWHRYTVGWFANDHSSAGEDGNQSSWFPLCSYWARGRDDC
jgi:hypothetical protein